MTDFYIGRARLDELINDVACPIDDVLAELDHIFRRELSAHRYYTEHPELLYEGHPWVVYVRSGDAEYLGWDRHQQFRTGGQRLAALAAQRARR